MYETSEELNEIINGWLLSLGLFRNWMNNNHMIIDEEYNYEWTRKSIYISLYNCL